MGGARAVVLPHMRAQAAPLPLPHPPDRVALDSISIITYKLSKFIPFYYQLMYRASYMLQISPAIQNVADSIQLDGDKDGTDGANYGVGAIRVLPLPIYGHRHPWSLQTSFAGSGGISSSKVDGTKQLYLLIINCASDFFDTIFIIKEPILILLSFPKLD